MKKIILLVILSIMGSNSLSYGQCDFTTKLYFHPIHMDINDNSSLWFKGVQFTAYDLAGRLIGRSPLPSPSIAVRPSYFPLHVYGDDPITEKIEGPENGGVIFVYSNLIKNCGVVISDTIITFTNWANKNINFQHPGDVNKDRFINMIDYKLVQNAITVQRLFGMYQCAYDVNGDGTVDANDGGLMGRVVLYNDPKSTLGKWGYGCM